MTDRIVSDRKLWSARTMLYMKCCTCEMHLSWRLVVGTIQLTASCCGAVFVATPLHDKKRFHVRVYEADLSNVTPIAFGALLR